MHASLFHMIEPTKFRPLIKVRADWHIQTGFTIGMMNFTHKTSHSPLTLNRNYVFFFFFFTCILGLQSAKQFPGKRHPANVFERDTLLRVGYD